MRVLVAWASKAGATKGIAEFIGEKLIRLGLQVDVEEVTTVHDVAGYDAYVIGSAVYMFHWMKEAKQFVSHNRKLLSDRPVWLFSSGPVGTSRTNAKGLDLLDVSVSGPREIGELREALVITGFSSGYRRFEAHRRHRIHVQDGTKERVCEGIDAGGRFP